MKHFLIVTTDNCKWCDLAKRVLDKFQYSYDELPAKLARSENLMERFEYRTYPLVLSYQKDGLSLVGGAAELFKLLDEMHQE